MTTDNKPASAPEEGGKCPACKDGVLQYPPVENCSCHISPPCGGCAENRLTCTECGWEEPEVYWPDTIVPKSQPNQWWEQWNTAFKRGHTFSHGGRVFEVTYDGRSGSTIVIKGRYEGPVTARDIIDHFGDGTFGRRGPTLVADRKHMTGPALNHGTFIYTQITD